MDRARGYTNYYYHVTFHPNPSWDPLTVACSCACTVKQRYTYSMVVDAGVALATYIKISEIPTETCKNSMAGGLRIDDPLLLEHGTIRSRNNSVICQMLTLTVTDCERARWAGGIASRFRASGAGTASQTNEYCCYSSSQSHSCVYARASCDLSTSRLTGVQRRERAVDRRKHPRGF